MTFDDLTKAFNTVCRDGFLHIMAKFGRPARFIAIVRQCHAGKLARVQNDGDYRVTNRVRKCCVLVPILYSMMFAAMLIDAFQDCDDGFLIRYNFDGKQFNLRRLQVKSVVQTGVLQELPHSDDMAKNASTEMKMQKTMSRVSQAGDKYDLRISMKKTEVVYQTAHGKPYSDPKR